MADFTPVALGIKTPDPNQGIQTLSGILGIQQQKQALQVQAQELQQKQIQTQQVAGVNQFFSQWNPADHIGDDGTLDLSSAHKDPAYQSLPGVARIAVDARINELRGRRLKQQKMSTLNANVVERGTKVLQAASESGPANRLADD